MLFHFLSGTGKESCLEDQMVALYHEAKLG